MQVYRLSVDPQGRYLLVLETEQMLPTTELEAVTERIARWWQGSDPVLVVNVRHGVVLRLERAYSSDSPEAPNE